MSGDFERWNNDPVNHSLHRVPPDIDQKMRHRGLSERERERRWGKFFLMMVFVGAAAAIWVILHT